VTALFYILNQRHGEKYSIRGKGGFERIVVMLNNIGFKFIIVVVGVILCSPPQRALGEDTEIKNQLSYVSKIIGAIEGSIITIEGNVRFIKRQAEKKIAEANVSAKRLDSLEAKIKNIEGLLAPLR
jgi:hypothetical protein